ncbi:hypothetical protein Acj133p203 [Acinetobacter phage 133]|uniref:Uncharacterized protein n=1 Tax=Acinetobacter phage 133 TaxID=2919552 RepID=D9I6D7_9CAUD|nr:hypothetical protein Acj133p203 [Acinetobacter phage 133]ADJ19518.1 hypothetical protein Acj133p203 [Acinetobacter phage 133]
MKTFTQIHEEVNSGKVYVLIQRKGKDGKTEVQMRDESFTSAQFARLKKQIESDPYEKSQYASIEVKGYKTFKSWRTDALNAKSKGYFSHAHGVEIASNENWFVPY